MPADTKDRTVPSRRRRIAGAAIVVATIGGLALLWPASRSEAPLLPDGTGRFETMVTVNGAGPFRFLLDTAAQMSCISQGLAARLRPWKVPFVRAQVIGASGAEEGEFRVLRRLRSPFVARWLEPVLVLPSQAATTADGVLGADLFARGRLELDFAGRRARLAPSGPAPPDAVVLPADVRPGHKVFVAVRVDGVQAMALLDTGARRTHGNLALQRALGLPDGDPRLRPTAPLTGATNQESAASAATVDTLRLGSRVFPRPTITFAPSPALEAAGFEDAPALVLGMDLLGQLRALAIDYPLREVRLH